LVEEDIFTAVTKHPAVLDRLVRSVHRMRHEHGTLWEPVAGCGCEEWVDQLLANWDDEPYTPEPDACDDCGRTDGTHDDEVEH
jgi:hypothetical protein